MKIALIPPVAKNILSAMLNNNIITKIGIDFSPEVKRDCRQINKKIV